MKNRSLCTLAAAAASVLALAAGHVSAQGPSPGGTPSTPGTATTSPPGPSGSPGTPSTTPRDPAGTGTTSTPGTVIEAQPTTPASPPVIVDSEPVTAPAEENALMRYLPWIAAAAAVLAVLAFLAMRNKGGQVIAAGSNVAAPKSDDTKNR